jgi:16S rRNA (uracil1498-N3)-methyltransferase
MKQFILNAVPDRNGQVMFEGGDYRYLARVRRLAPGEYFPALLPGGDEVLVRVLSVDKNTLVGGIAAFGGGQAAGQETVSAAVWPQLPPIILFQALPKGDKMDLIVRQAAEGGLAEIVPFVSEYSTAKTNNGQKFSRWERIIKEARQQSGSAVPTVIRKPVQADGIFPCWEQVKTRYPGVIGLLFHHVPLANDSLHGYLSKGSGLQSDKYPAVVLAVGPEGGFSPVEAERFTAAGFRPYTIKGAVLRTETAALYAVAAVQILLTERDSWETK